MMDAETMYEIMMREELKNQDAEYDSCPDIFMDIHDDLLDETQQLFSKESEATQRIGELLGSTKN